MQTTISPWLIRQREAKKLATARTISRRYHARHPSHPSDRADPIMASYEGVPSWALKQGLIKVRTF